MVRQSTLSAIEKVIIGLLEQSRAITLSSIGGLAALLEGWDTVIRSPLADEMLAGLIVDEGTKELPNGKSILDLFTAVISVNQNPLVIRNTALLISENADKLTKIFDTLLKLLEEDRGSFVRGQYLLAAFQISLLETPKRYRLIAFLIEERTIDDQEFLQYQIKILGLGYAHFSNEDLLVTLQQLGDKLNQKDEWFFEMGMAFLSKSLQIDQVESVKRFLAIANSHFEQAEMLGREDGRCFHSMIEIIFEFYDGTDSSGLHDKILELRQALICYHAYNRYNPSMGWTSLREEEMVSWYAMCDRISELCTKLGPIGWLNPVLVIEEYLLEIYSGQRSLLKYDRSGGIDGLIRPAIVRKLSPLNEKIGILEQWMAEKTDHVRASIARDLVFDIERYKSGFLSGNEYGTISPDVQDVVPSISSMSAIESELWVRFLRDQLSVRATRTDRHLRGIFTKMCLDLEKAGFSKDREIWMGFSTIFFQSLVFLENRMNATVRHFPNIRYLFSGKHVNESELQHDYFQFMLSSSFACKVSTERMDIGGGRADIFFSFLDFFIVAEVKREQTKKTMDSLADKYIGQTLAYQSTSAKLGLLLVLDLVDKGNASGSLESNVKLLLDHRASPDRAVIVIRVPGNRTTPSQVRKVRTAKVSRLGSNPKASQLK
ncbi:hypothetical protein [Pedobacter immunditicola]|uniref:hypothetical protein n=1 Tax=Pedobacter immunditicola TaxID=3133440 RepID=UPI00309D7130